MQTQNTSKCKEILPFLRTILLEKNWSPNFFLPGPLSICRAVVDLLVGPSLLQVDQPAKKRRVTDLGGAVEVGSLTLISATHTPCMNTNDLSRHRFTVYAFSFFSSTAMVYCPISSTGHPQHLMFSFQVGLQIFFAWDRLCLVVQSYNMWFIALGVKQDTLKHQQGCQPGNKKTSLLGTEFKVCGWFGGFSQK